MTDHQHQWGVAEVSVLDGPYGKPVAYSYTRRCKCGSVWDAVRPIPEAKRVR